MSSTCNFEEMDELHPARMANQTTGAALPNSDSRVLPEEKFTESETVGKVADGGCSETKDKQLDESESSAQPGHNLQNADSSTIEKSAMKKPTKRTAEIGAETPKAQIASPKSEQVENSCKNPTSRMRSLQQNPSTATKLTKQTPMSKARTTKGSTLRLTASALKNSANIDIRQENEVIKWQKLDGQRSRQILNVKERVLHHKSEVVASKEKAANRQTTKTCREKRYELTVKKEINSSVSAAELVNKFHSRTREREISHELHFATDKRIPPVQPVLDLFHKLSINSDCRDKGIPPVTIPNPFSLQTEERGLEKEKRFLADILHEQLEAQKARVPKAGLYPYSTDYPVMPPKPQPKECTKPEAFKLVSLIRHEEEMHRLTQERERKEKEAAEKRKFKAKPILKRDPVSVSKKKRIPLTQVHEFTLHIDQRAVDRADFDKKVKEKEAAYRRYREEYEAAKAMEEEKATKQMRRMMVPHARPVPSFTNPFVPERSLRKLTKPKSPCLPIAQRKQRTRAAGFAHMR